MKRVKNKVAIVTGGASGLGKSSAKLLAREGAKIVVSDIDEEGGKKVVQQIKEDGGEAIFIKQDVAKEDEWKNVIETTLETYGKLHILANSAGIGLGGTVEDVTLEDWKNLIDINLNGTFLKAVLPFSLNLPPYIVLNKAMASVSILSILLISGPQW